MPTQAQIDATQIKSDEAKKIKLEKTFVKEIKSLFNRMNKENAQSIAATGSPIVASKFQQEWESLLRKHYIRVQDKFEGDIENLLPEDEQGLSDAESAALITALISWRDRRARQNSQIITNTNDRQIKESVSQGRELFLEQNERAPGNRELALTTAAIFKRKYKGRVNSIAMTETQASAENTKYTEAAVLSGATPDQLRRPETLHVESVKIWRDFGDKLVRAIHKAINGVRKKINAAFTSGGEQLMYPGDTSLGATMKNIASCRCSLNYRIKRVRR